MNKFILEKVNSHIFEQKSPQLLIFFPFRLEMIDNTSLLYFVPLHFVPHSF